MMPTDPAERSAMAAEYVMGSLPADEHAQFEQALAREFELQREVYYWQDKLLPLTRLLAPQEPAADVWTRIERSLPVASQRPSPRQRWWSDIDVWRFGAAVAAALALALALKLMWPGATPQMGERYFAVLQSPDKQEAGWIVEAAAGGKLRLIPLTTARVAEGKSLQFWTKPKNAAAPTSLGLVPPDRVTEIDTARLPALEREQLFELTLEPQSGSPIGRPTGPILFVGRTAAPQLP